MILAAYLSREMFQQNRFASDAWITSTETYIQWHIDNVLTLCIDTMHYGEIPICFFSAFEAETRLSFSKHKKAHVRMLGRLGLRRAVFAQHKYNGMRAWRRTAARHGMGCEGQTMALALCLAITATVSYCTVPFTTSTSI